MKTIKVRSFDTFDSVIIGHYSPSFAVVPDEFPEETADIYQGKKGTVAYDSQHSKWPCFGHGETKEEAGEDSVG